MNHVKAMKAIEIVILCLIVLIWFAIASAAFGVERPPEPNDVTFNYDPNLLPSQLLGWQVVQTGQLVTHTIKAAVLIVDAEEPNLAIAVTHGTVQDVNSFIISDAVAGAWYHKWWTLNYVAPSTPQVVYIGATVTSTHAESDERSYILNVIAPPPKPVIYEWEPPIPAAILYGDEDTMLARQKKFQEFAKLNDAKKVAR